MKIKKLTKNLLFNLIRIIPSISLLYYTKETQTPIKFQHFIFQKLLRINSKAYWPMHFTSKVVNPKNVYLGVDVNPGYMPGCYIQAGDKIYIDDYTQIGPGVGIISTNHNPYNNKLSQKKRPIKIGKYCWIGMNAVILPGVRLGDFTIVAAGSVVSRSFSKGYCIIGGNPAEFMFTLDKNKCVSYKNKYLFNGFISNTRFLEYARKKNINHIDIT